MFLEPLAGHRDAYQSDIGNRPLELANHRRSVVDNVLKRQQADRFQSPIGFDGRRPLRAAQQQKPSSECGQGFYRLSARRRKHENPREHRRIRQPKGNLPRRSLMRIWAAAGGIETVMAFAP